MQLSELIYGHKPAILAQSLKADDPRTTFAMIIDDEKLEGELRPVSTPLSPISDVICILS